MRNVWVCIGVLVAACTVAPTSVPIDAPIVLEHYNARVGGEHTYDLHLTAWPWVDYGSRTSRPLRVPRDEAIMLEVRSEQALSARVEGTGQSLPIRSGTTVVRLRARRDGALLFGSFARFRIVAEPRSAHDAWLHEEPPQELLPCTGEILMSTKGCAACHGRPETELAGPTLCGLRDRERQFEDGTRLVLTGDVLDDYLRESILAPNAHVVVGRRPVMPRIQLTPREMSALVSHVRMLDDDCETGLDCPAVRFAPSIDRPAR